MQPVLTKDQVLQKRGDLSPFLIHLTRSGTYKKWADASNQPFDNFHTLDAKTSLMQILSSSRIEARCPFGYFNFKVRMKNRFGSWSNPNSGILRPWLHSACFTETPIEHVKLQCMVVCS